MLSFKQYHALENLQVVILRHAEKPSKGDNLSHAGFERAMILPAVLTAKFGVPDYIYVAAPALGKVTKCMRMMQTAWPLAIKYNLAVNTRYQEEETRRLAENILKKSGTVFVIWEHRHIPAIVTALGISNFKRKWDANDYDSLWVVSICGNKKGFSQDLQEIEFSSKPAMSYLG